MRLILIGLCLTLMACGNSVEKIETKWVSETEKAFDAIIPEGNYRARYKAIHALPSPQLCEAVLPLQRLDWIFIPMLEPVGVIRWTYEPQLYLDSDQTSNSRIAVDRLYNELTAATRDCRMTKNLPTMGSPWEDRECGAVAVRTVCGNEFVSEANYDRLLEIAEERKIYRNAKNTAFARAAYKAANPTTYCTGSTIGGISNIRCN